MLEQQSIPPDPSQIDIGNPDSLLPTPGFQAVDTTLSGKPLARRIEAMELTGDGRLDLATAGYDEVSILLANGDGTFRGLENPVLRGAEFGMGSALGDIDNDGDTDILITNNGGPARLLINQVGQRANWIGLRLLDTHGRDALGARVELELEDGRRWGRVHSDGSYASASDARLVLGLGPHGRTLDLRVQWPDGRDERFGPLPVNRHHQLRQGRGQRKESADQ